MLFRAVMLTGEQIRAARALARIEQAQLAKRCGLSLETIKRLERIRGPVEANVRTLNAIVEAFKAIGVYFEHADDGGVSVGYTPVRTRPAALPRNASPEAEGPVVLLRRLIYASEVAPAHAPRLQAVLGEIVEVARRRNAELEVTGALMASNGRFLQALEGPKEAVMQIYGAISSDPRHTALRVLDNRVVASRVFADFSLCCGLFESDQGVFANEPAMRNGLQPDALTPAAALGLLSIVRDLQREAPRIDRGEVCACALAGQCLDRACACGGAGEPVRDCA